MTGSPQIVVCPLTEALTQDVVRIHRRGLGYTVNSRLGTAHLTFLYQNMSRDPQSYVGVAMVDDKPVGIVSGTLDENRLKSRLMGSMSARRLVGLAGQFLLRPMLAMQWLQGIVIALPVHYGREDVVAVLTALAVEPNHQTRGVGRRLVLALENFFVANRVGKYRLDTLASNQRALKFYCDLGFSEVARRAGSVILVREIGESQ